VHGNIPSLKTRVPVCVTLENLKRDALLSEVLGKSKTTNTSSDDEDVHPDDCVVWLSLCQMGVRGTRSQLSYGTEKDKNISYA